MDSLAIDYRPVTSAGLRASGVALPGERAEREGVTITPLRRDETPIRDTTDDVQPIEGKVADENGTSAPGRIR